MVRCCARSVLKLALLLCARGLRAVGARSSLGIESNGSIKACPSLPSSAYVGGNVRDSSLVDIWERAEPLRFTRGDEDWLID